MFLIFYINLFQITAVLEGLDEEKSGNIDVNHKIESDKVSVFLIKQFKNTFSSK